MGRRKSKSNRRRNRGNLASPQRVVPPKEAVSPQEAAPAQKVEAPVSAGSAKTTTASPTRAATAAAATAAAVRASAGSAGGAPAEAGLGDRSALRPWRGRVQDLLDHLHGWSRASYGPALDDWLTRHFGSPQALEAAPDEDVDRAIEDYVCSPGSAGDERSILSVFVEQAPGPEGGPMDPEDRAQARRWERERHRGVFVIQHAARDRLTLWDPLEGAPLTLHLLRKLGQARAEGLQRGTIVTATYQPWMARLVAIGAVEFFADERAITLFRAETMESGAQWHEAPPAAPQPGQRARQ